MYRLYVCMFVCISIYIYTYIRNSLYMQRQLFELQAVLKSLITSCLSIDAVGVPNLFLPLLTGLRFRGANTAWIFKMPAAIQQSPFALRDRTLTAS